MITLTENNFYAIWDDEKSRVETSLKYVYMYLQKNKGAYAWDFETKNEAEEALKMSYTAYMHKILDFKLTFLEVI